mgnify:CR=1 FL=1
MSIIIIFDFRLENAELELIDGILPKNPPRTPFNT